MLPVLPLSSAPEIGVHLHGGCSVDIHRPAMPSEPEPGPAFRPRPLPTVDVALLPHELQAARAKQTALVFGLVVVALAIVGALFHETLFTFFRPTDGRPHPKTANNAPQPSSSGAGMDRRLDVAKQTSAPMMAQVPSNKNTSPSAKPKPEHDNSTAVPHSPSLNSVTLKDGTEHTKTVPFGNAPGFRTALLNASVSSADASALITSLSKLVDFRRCRPEHRLSFTLAADGSVSEFEYLASRMDRYRATRNGAGFDAKKVEIPVDVRRVAKGGYVRDSLGKALDHSKLGTALVGAFVEAFERTVSFKRDTREGDSFRIIVEERYVENDFLNYGAVQAIEYNGERVGTLRGFWFKPTGGIGDFYGLDGRAINGGWLRTPLRYDHISSPFNLRRRHPVLKKIMPHNGIDYAASRGTKVSAAASGTVAFAGYKGANGNLVSIKHQNGYETFYAHLSRISRGIKRGTHVSQRQQIGAVGTTGRSTGPHLHFALKRRGKFVDPAKQLNGPGKNLPSRDMVRFRKLKAKLNKELAAIALSPAPPKSVVSAFSKPETFHDEGAVEL